MITITAGLHSADKPHQIMTGGTLTVDKTIESTEPLQIHTYTLNLFGKPTDEAYYAFHAGMHTNEHLLAYSPDTGSLRASLEGLIPGFDKKSVLDISPFETETGYGFRVTSLVEIDEPTLKAATQASVKKAISYLDKIKTEGDPAGFLRVPFATARQCGQFTFHDPDQAKESLQSIDTETLHVETNTLSTMHTKAIVCDLRLLKPKTDVADTRITLDPKFSYYISKKIEHELPEKIVGTAAVVGTFGCMTGTYLCVSYLNSQEEDVPHIHAKIMEILQEINKESLTDDHRKQLETILENYELYGQK